MAKKRTAISPTRAENYAEWYQQVIKYADLAENSEVRGCMVIKPWGYAIWENIKKNLDEMFRETGHKNAYFPLFIPKSYFEKEAEHVEGFAKECAVVTHSRLEDDGRGKLVPAGKLTEELVVRPTSETIIGASFSKWINSYRDMPLLINQWANVVRWEMRTRLFLRTTEFLWQEGHTAHSSEEEAISETNLMLNTYVKFAEDFLAIPVIKGEKTESERFPGAVSTFTFEAMMQDKKALQAGTSHFLGQKFAKASNIKFQNKEGKEEFAWTTSWGVTTRLIGALIMVHSDDNGLVLPPKIAPSHIAIIPVCRDEEQKNSIMKFIENLVKELKAKRFNDGKIYVEVDDRDITSSEKTWYWIKKGIPIRLEIGPRDIENNSVILGRRDFESTDKKSISKDELVDQIENILNDIQKNIYNKAKEFLTKNIVRIDDKQEFYSFFTPKNKKKPEIYGGFVVSHWCGSEKCEKKIKDDLKVTIRCIPLDAEIESGNCIVCGDKSNKRVFWAKSY